MNQFSPFLSTVVQFCQYFISLWLTQGLDGAKGGFSGEGLNLLTVVQMVDGNISLGQELNCLKLTGWTMDWFDFDYACDLLFLLWEGFPASKKR